MSRAKELLKAGLNHKTTDSAVETKANDNSEIIRKPAESIPPPVGLEAVLLENQPRTNRIVKRTFEMRDSHVEILDKVVKKAKLNGKRITQSDALQFILDNWNERFGEDLIGSSDR